MIGALTTLVLLAATHEIVATPSRTYSPDGLRVTAGDTVRWDANGTHPLRFDGEAGGPYTGGTHERVLTASVRFYCGNHGGPGGAGMSGVVTVGNENTAPSITVVRDPGEPAAGTPVSLHAVVSDPERLPLRIDWDMDGDGTFERADAGTSVSAAYAAGSWTVAARAIDDLGAIAVGSHTFTVGGASPPGTTPPGTTPPGGTAPVGQPPQVDTLAPTVSVTAPRRQAVRKVRRRGIRVRVTPSEDGRLVADLRTRSGRRLARATAEAHAGDETALRLRPRRVRAGRLRLRVVAIDTAGNRAVVKRRVTVT